VKCKHFLIEQLVPPEISSARGDGAWELLDSAALISLDQLVDAFGRMTVNNWHTGGNFRESGLRLPGTRTGAVFSQHKYGRAFDIKPIDVKPQFIYAEILKDPKRFPFITTLEDISATSTPSGGWVHFDTRNNPAPGIRIVKP
jgi:hypothetical protein